MTGRRGVRKRWVPAVTLGAATLATGLLAIATNVATSLVPESWNFVEDPAFAWSAVGVLLAATIALTIWAAYISSHETAGRDDTEELGSKPELRGAAPTLLSTSGGTTVYLEAGSNLTLPAATMSASATHSLAGHGNAGQSAPSPGRRHAARNDEVAAIRAHVLTENIRKSVASQVVAIVGMGGVGKTSLLMDVASDDFLRGSWLDRPEWIVCGSSRSPTELQRRLAASLNVSAVIGDDAEENRRVLAAAMSLRPRLVILDDVRTIDQARALVLDVPGAPTALSTRLWRVADSVGATVFPLEATDEATACRILAAHVACSPDELPEQGVRVARWCGRLPLALAVAGAMIRNRVYSWSELDDLLSKGPGRIALLSRAADLPGYEPTSLRSIIEASLSDLPVEVREAFTTTAAVVRTPAFPRAVFRDATAHLHGNSEDQALAAEEKLVERSLFGRRFDTNGDVELTVHDLLVEFCLEVREARLANEVLVDNLLNRLPLEVESLAREIRVLLRSAYYRDELIGHLVRAGRADLVRKVLCDLPWMSQRIVDFGVRALVEDFAHGGQVWPLPRVRTAVAESANILAARPNELYFQLEARMSQEAVAHVCHDSSDGGGGRRDEIGRVHVRPIRRDSFRRDERLILSARASSRALLSMVVVPGQGRLITVDLHGVVDLLDLSDGRSVARSRLTSIGQMPAIMLRYDSPIVLVNAGGVEALAINASTGEINEIVKRPDLRGLEARSVLSVTELLSWAGASAAVGITRSRSIDGGAVNVPYQVRAGDFDTRSSLVAISGPKEMRWWALEDGLNGVVAVDGNLVGLRVVDRQRVLLFLSNGGMALYEIASGGLKWQVQSHQDWIECCSFDLAADAVATGGHDHCVVVTALQDGRTLFRRKERAGYVQAVHLWSMPAFQGEADAVGVAWSPLDESIRVREVTGGNREALLLAHSGRVNEIVTSDSGETLLSCSDDGFVQGWDVCRLFDSSQLKDDHRERVSYAVRVGASVWSGSYDGSVRVWRRDGTLAAVSQYQHGPVHVMLPIGQASCVLGFESGVAVRLDLLNDRLTEIWVSEHGGWIASGVVIQNVVYLGAGDGSIHGLAQEDGRLVGRLLAHDAAVRCLVRAADGIGLYSGGEDARILRWNTAERRAEAENREHTDWVNGITLDPLHDRVHSVSDDGTLRTFRAADLSPLAPPMQHDGWLQAVCIGASSHALSGGQDMTISKWDTERGVRVDAVEAHGGTITSLARFPGTSLVLSTGADGKVALWDPVELRPVCTATVDSGISVNTVVPDGDGELAFGCDDGTMHFLNVDGLSEIRGRL